jgi:hypothetical protein
MPEEAALARLERARLVRRGERGLETTRRWQAAMARAALRLHRTGAPWADLRLPIATALVETVRDLTDEEVAGCVEVLLPLEAAPFTRLFPRDADAP